MELIFLFGFLISPQPRVYLFSRFLFPLPYVDFSISFFHLMIGISSIIAGAWIAIWAVKEMSEKVGFKVVDTHSAAKKVVTSGPYTIVRHPQHLGAILSYIGGSVLFSAYYALLFLPIYVTCNYLISWKEEKELVKEHGKKYQNYQEETPMIIPDFF
ncbi:hypothetical protein AKJ40_03760 [candidate division MSBL1 archaeon SCGC-AAA259M10]|uniref:Steroid 5-alpha reductase C-terminal domain-containing protein n=1 Tax=candidate division MSBL1 archaeon SCGC-AAA259M10 TaxID=1698270 RepID=A0A133UYB3_9EURY|nr:hypothetical protein AKJ40_03760 [candidate division MSBL1 archaeon SCGC-AAA259M10]